MDIFSIDLKMDSLFSTENHSKGCMNIVAFATIHTNWHYYGLLLIMNR